MKATVIRIGSTQSYIGKNPLPQVQQTPNSTKVLPKTGTFYGGLKMP